MTKSEQIRPAILFIAIEGESCASLMTPLHQGGYQIHEASSVKAAVKLAQRVNPIAILLDTNQPSASGLPLICSLHKTVQAPIIVLSNSNDVGDKVAALDHGAVDYMARPFGTGELLARIRARSRDCRFATDKRGKDFFRCGALTIDFIGRIVKVGAQRVNLTPNEFNLLGLLVSRAGSVLPYRQILRSLWGSEDDADKIRALRVHFCSLRNKIETDPSAPSFLITEPRIGYRLAMPG